MKLELNARELKTDLASISKCINASAVLPILEDFLIEAKDGIISMTATDLETSVTITREVDYKGEFKTCIPAKQFNHFISKSISEKIYLEPLKNDTVKLYSGDFSGKMACDTFLNYPVIVNPDKSDSITIKHEILAPHFVSALKFVSNDYLRPSMTGIYVHKDEGSLRVAATNAHSLYFDEIIKTKTEIPSFIIPAKSARLFLSLFKKKEFELYSNGTHVVFQGKSEKLICRSIDARYPDYKMVIPKHDLDFYLKRKQLSALLQLSSEYINQSTHQITLAVSKDSVNITGGDVDFSFDFECSIPNYNASREFEPFNFSVDLKMLSKIIQSNKDEYVKVHHSTAANKAVVIDDKFLIMPLMTSY